MVGDVTGLIAIVLIFGAIPAAIVIIYYFGRNAKHKERLAMIEKGIDVTIDMKTESTFMSALLWGMLVTGIGLGFLLGYVLSVVTPLREEYVMPGLSLLFGGLGLIGFYIYKKKTEVKSAQ